MFDITGSGSNWKIITNLLSNLNEECKFTIKRDGIEFKCMDIDHSALVDFTWNSNNFKKFECDTDEVILGIQLTEFSKIIKRCKDEDIRIRGGGEKNNLVISIGDKKEYGLALWNVDEEIPKGVDKDDQYKISINIPVKTLSESLDDIHIINPYMTVKITNGNIQLSAKSDNSNGKVSLDFNTIKVDEDIENDFSVEHIQKALSAVSNSIEEVEFKLANRMPMNINFNIKEMGNIKFYLAPYQVPGT